MTSPFVCPTEMVVLRVALSALVLPASALPNEYKRDILGLLHGDGDPTTSTVSTHGVLSTTKTLATSSTSSFGQPSPSTSLSASSQPMPTPTSRTDPAVSTPIKTSLASAPSTPPAPAESQASSSKTWQIIGIAIISILFIATSVTCAMFFDRLWKFLTDVLCCTSRPPVSEELIPDCESQSWDTRTPSPSDFNHESPPEKASIYARPRELPWNTDTQDWCKLHRQPSGRNDHPPAA